MVKASEIISNNIMKQNGKKQIELADYLGLSKQERKINSSFPSDCFVLENQGIDGLIVICNKAGKVFSLQYSKIEKIHDSIASYLDECIKRIK